MADLRSGAGPLGGIEAALAHYAGRSDATVLLPCDLPGITAAEIARLVAAYRKGPAAGGIVVAETGGFFWHSLCAVVHNGLLSEVSRAIDEARRGVGELWRRLGAVGVRFDDETPLFNVNTPEDMHDWLRRRGST